MLLSSALLLLKVCEVRCLAHYLPPKESKHVSRWLRFWFGFFELSNGYWLQLNVVLKVCSSVESHHLALDSIDAGGFRNNLNHNTIAQSLCEVFITFFYGVSVKSETITKIWFPPVQRNNNNDQRFRESAINHKTTRGRGHMTVATHHNSPCLGIVYVQTIVNKYIIWRYM